jgi:hypothetical protein
MARALRIETGTLGNELEGNKTNEYQFPRTDPFMTIYVKLLGEGTDVWRPTQAERVDENTVRLLPTADYGAYDEQWEFSPESIVRYENRILSGEDVMVAIAEGQ